MENDAIETTENDEDERVLWLRRIETMVEEFLDAILQPKDEDLPRKLEDKDIAGPPDKT